MQSEPLRCVRRYDSVKSRGETISVIIYLAATTYLRRKQFFYRLEFISPEFGRNVRQVMVAFGYRMTAADRERGLILREMIDSFWRRIRLQLCTGRKQWYVLWGRAWASENMGKYKVESRTCVTLLMFSLQEGNYYVLGNMYGSERRDHNDNAVPLEDDTKIDNARAGMICYGKVCRRSCSDRPMTGTGRAACGTIT